MVKITDKAVRLRLATSPADRRAALAAWLDDASRWLGNP